MPGGALCPGILRCADMLNGQYWFNFLSDIAIQCICGRLGQVLCDMIAQREDCRVIAGIDIKDGKQNGIPVYDSLEKLDGKGDVIIDFSSPAAVEKALPYCEAHKLPIVVCTTGLSEELQLKVVQLSRIVPVFKSANMSIGITLLSELSKRASAILGANYAIEIVEQHHHNKLDAPSGTALAIADAICSVRPDATKKCGRNGFGKRTPQEIGIHAVRIGNVVGEHEVIVGTGRQTLTLKHEAHDRSLFAEGALAAAEFLCTLPENGAGLYSMKDLVAID